MPKRVFIGYNNIVGTGTSLKHGFAGNNISAEFYSNEMNVHKYDKDNGIKFKKVRKLKNRYLNFIYLHIFLLTNIMRFDYFIIIQAGGNLLKEQKDIRLLKFFKKRTMVILTGCDARIPELVEEYKWNPCSTCNIDYKKLVNCKIEDKKKLLKTIENNYKFVASPVECAGYLTRPYVPFNFPIITEDYKPQYSRKGNTFRIVHAPSNYHVKGTNYINECVKELQIKYPQIEYICLNNVSNETVIKTICESDLIIDQMLVGYYGVLSVEAMALGKPVVCYIREDIWKKISKDCPIINANPDTLYSKLEELILKKENVASIGKESRRYVENFHDSKVIAKKLLDQFETIN